MSPCCDWLPTRSPTRHVDLEDLAVDGRADGCAVDLGADLRYLGLGLCDGGASDIQIRLPGPCQQEGVLALARCHCCAASSWTRRLATVSSSEMACLAQSAGRAGIHRGCDRHWLWRLQL